MKLILKHSWHIPYVASGTQTHPFEYSSKEDAFVDFTELMESADFEFKFLGNTFYAGDDDYDFYDLDEWFEFHKLKIKL